MSNVEMGEKKLFEYSLGDVTITVPTFGDLSYTVMRDFMKFKKTAESEEVVWWLIENVFKKYATNWTEDITSNQLFDFVSQYSEASNLGE